MPPSTVAACPFDGVTRKGLTSYSVEPGATPRLRPARGGVAPGSTSRCGPRPRQFGRTDEDARFTQVRRSHGASGRDIGGDIAPWVSCHPRSVAVRVSVARSGSYRRLSACTRSRHGGNAAASTSVLEMLDVCMNCLFEERLEALQCALGMHVGDPDAVILAFLVPRHLLHEVASRRAATGTPGCVTPLGHDGRNRSLTQERNLFLLRRQESRARPIPPGGGCGCPPRRSPRRAVGRTGGKTWP